jgi:hypothetical protein
LRSELGRNIINGRTARESFGSIAVGSRGVVDWGYWPYEEKPSNQDNPIVAIAKNDFSEIRAIAKEPKHLWTIRGCSHLNVFTREGRGTSVNK